MLLSPLLKRLIRTGNLTIIKAAGHAETFGPGDAPTVTVRFHNRTLPYRILFNPTLAVGEAYMDGTLTIEQGTLRDFLHLCTVGFPDLDCQFFNSAWRRLTHPFRTLRQYNPIHRARKNVSHHYDLSGHLYDMFLDSDRQYSCAYFENGNESLEEAQEKKRRHIMAKLLPEPGMTVLDIGSGWGGLALNLAQTANVNVKGITLSQEQLQAANERAARSGLSEQVRFGLQDYRAERDTYDRIVSVGMFEHVGVPHYREYFVSLRRLLKPDGIALVHAIGSMEPPATGDPWIGKYIFPGGYCPALSEVLAEIEKAGLWVTDIEILRLHYAETLRHWFERFQAKRHLAAQLYDERFCRMWEFYLAASEIAFRNGPMMVFQIQLARRRDAVPLTRDYITDLESRFGQTKDRAA
tara:strand:- start:678 stop:1904 length:1227 start_codon:yes stop_codon:yes gene_type:complete